jgi:hypothetical protein
MIAFFAASTTLSGVSFGQLMITDFCGTEAMAQAARSATKKLVRAKRIIAVYVKVLRSSLMVEVE